MFTKHRFMRIPLLCLCFATAACVDMSRAEVGRVVGAIAGTVIGSEVSGGERDAMIIGGLLGAYVGGEIGEALDEEDMMLMSGIAIYVLDHGSDGYSRSWRNRHSRHYGHFTAHSTYRTPDATLCRRYTNTFYLSSRPQRSAGTACMQRDGRWSIIRSTCL